MNQQNVASIETARQRSNRKLVNITELGGSDVGFYKANVKTHLMMFIYEQISDIKQSDAAQKLDVTQAQVNLLKNLRVSQFSIDRLFEMAYRAGFTFNMHPQQIENHPNHVAKREVK